jgi:glycosyltransferase involved in cell wall biosynthesis
VDASIIIPAYNRRERLVETLRALDALCYPRDAFEVLLVDDGSQDGTAQFFRQRGYSFQFHCLRHSRNRGRSAARNSGVKNARGRIVVFLDDDMQAVPDLLREHLRHHRGDHGTVVLGNIRHGHEIPATALIRYLDSRGVHKMRAGDPIPFRYFSAGNVSMERDFLLRVGLFDERFRSFGGEDLELGYRLSRGGARFVFAPDALAYRFDYRDIPNLCRAMEIFGRDSLPIILQIHPQLGGLFKLQNVQRASDRRTTAGFLLRPPFLRLLLLPPLGTAARGVARALNRFHAPALLFDYLLFFHLMKGYRQSLRNDAGMATESSRGRKRRSI